MTPDPNADKVAELPHSEPCLGASDAPDQSTAPDKEVQTALLAHVLGGCLIARYKQALTEHLTKLGALIDANDANFLLGHLYDFGNYPYMVLLWKETYLRGSVLP